MERTFKRDKDAPLFWALWWLVRASSSTLMKVIQRYHPLRYYWICFNISTDNLNKICHTDCRLCVVGCWQAPFHAVFLFGDHTGNTKTESSKERSSSTDCINYWCSWLLLTSLQSQSFLLISQTVWNKYSSYLPLRFCELFLSNFGFLFHHLNSH
jgi:hypothetical protein